MIEKRPIPISMVAGLSQKKDPWQLNVGEMQALKDISIDKAGLYQKRNGYDILSNTLLSGGTALPQGTSVYAGENTLLVGGTKGLFSFLPSTNSWLQAGNYTPAQLSISQAVRTPSAQVNPDTAVHSSGLTVLCWEDSSGPAMYQVTDTKTGTVIVAPTSLGGSTALPHAFALGTYVIVTYVSASSLYYIAIPVSKPASPSAPASITSSLGTSIAYDGIAANNTLYLVWNDSASTKVGGISSSLNAFTPVIIEANNASTVSVAVDVSGGNPVVWASYFTTALKAAAYNFQLSVIHAPVTLVASPGTLASVTGTATGGVLTCLYQTQNTYSYGSVRSDFVSAVTCTQTGTVGTPGVIVRSLGLASKGFTYNGVGYFLGAYQGGGEEPTYFLMNNAGSPVAKLAFGNGGGYPTKATLANVCITSAGFVFPYLYKDSLTTQSGVAYSNTGINLALINFTAPYGAINLAGVTHLPGGYLWMFDGVTTCEHGFHLFPEDLGSAVSATGGGIGWGQLSSQPSWQYAAIYSWVDASGKKHRSAVSLPVTAKFGNATTVSFTGNTTSGSTAVTSVSSVSGLFLGQVVSGTGIQAGSTIASLGTTTLTLSLPATATGSTVALSTKDTGSCVVEVPTLRVTLKRGTNPAQVELYRTTANGTNFYRVSSVSSPVLNSLTADFVTFTDTLSDAQIIGNELLYTTGAVLENIGAPATNAITVYGNRLFLVNAEDQNLVWFSKEVVEGVPVELSDLLTIYASPTAGVQNSTGPVEVLAPMDDKVILFRADAAYYESGQGPDNLGQNSDYTTPTFIAGTVGCTNPASVVLTPAGLLFQSDKGIWLLNRNLQTSYAGAAIDDIALTYMVTSANCVPGTNQVRFLFSNGQIAYYDYFFGIWGTHSTRNAASATIFGSSYVYLSQYGGVYRESLGAFLDSDQPVLQSFTTGWISPAGLQGYVRSYYLYLLGKFLSPHKIVVQIAYDFNPAQVQQVVITPDNYSGPWGSDPAWGGTSTKNYGGVGNPEQWKIHMQRQRCESFQITLTELYDPTLGVPAGAGFTLSGMTLVVGIKKGFYSMPAARTVG